MERGRKMRIYISGKITGVENYKEHFEKAEKYLHEKYPDAEIVNPCKIKRSAEILPYKEYLKTDLEELFKCDTIYFLNSFLYSKGSRIEGALAEALDIKMIFEASNEWIQ